MPQSTRRPTSLAAVALAFSALALAAPAHAAPGLGGEVYGAQISEHELELEARYGQLNGGTDGGKDKLRLEAAYGVNSRLELAMVGKFAKSPGSSRQTEAVSVEAIYRLGQIGGIDVAAYGEYEVGLQGSDAAEVKLLLQRKQGPWDFRFNLVAEKRMIVGAPVELAYATSGDVEVASGVRLGLAAFGELGTFRRFAPRAEHFIGPVAKFKIKGIGEGLQVKTGYLFAAGKALNSTSGQFRLNLEIEL